MCVQNKLFRGIECSKLAAVGNGNGSPEAGGDGKTLSGRIFRLMLRICKGRLGGGSVLLEYSRIWGAVEGFNSNRLRARDSIS